tara:strand:- start:24302 stop:24682 length:381 start_codon:yes stop_codon:yes gene_type:complete
MDEKLTFIYDGQCPFCNQFAELLELKSNIPSIEIKDARSFPVELPSSYDIDVEGALLIADDQMLSGANAINYICSKLKDPSDNLLKILAVIFQSSKRTRIIFPILIFSRRATLLFKGVPRKLITEE